MISPSFAFDRAIVRRPGNSVVKGLRADGGEDPSLAGILAEHGAYVAALRDAGLKVTELEPLEEFPDAIFVEDPALVFTQGAVLLNPGAPSRAGEGAHLRPALESAFERVLTLPEGCADGGDVLTMGEQVYIGLSGRTDRQGAEALAQLLAGLGLRAEVVETPPQVLHLKTGCTQLDDETLLVLPELEQHPLFAGYRRITVPEGERGGSNVLRLADRVLASKRFPRLLDRLNAEGYAVVALDTAEIARIDAGLTCMSLRWKSR